MYVSDLLSFVSLKVVPRSDTSGVGPRELGPFTVADGR